MAELPTGTVTFLFTDLEGSTRLWEAHPDAMKGALARHDEILRDAVETNGGHVVKTTGDGLHAAFKTATGAIAAAAAGQRALADVEGPEGPLRVRMGLHTGSAEIRDGDYYGSAVNRAARVAAAAHGGQIVVSNATEELVRDDLAPDVALLDLGEHRLRDLSRPERVHQVAAPGLSDEFPPLRSIDAFPGNLPSQLTSFVGRDEELARVAKALDEARLVTLTGVGGVGKTRLAIQVAAEVLPRFPDGAWLCELAAATDPDALAQVVAATLGVSPRPGVTLDESIVSYLANRDLLLVIDNCEHLLDAAGSLAESILLSCPGVRILATSREGLAVMGEQVWPLRSLAMPRTGKEPDLAGLGAVQLFVDRARAARPGFGLEGANSAAVAEICRRLDGIPLAIELAAARVEAMSATEIAALLDERFRLLTGGRRTAVERHQTLRAAVDWSYSMLTDTERLVFDRLGVFAGTFDAVAASAVASGDGVQVYDVRDALSALVVKSLLVRDETSAGVTRYQMLETLKQYAREILDERGETDAWRRRHAEHYAGFAEAEGPELRGVGEIESRVRVGEEIDNLRAAVLWALDAESPADVELGLRIISELGYESTQSRSAGIAVWAEMALPRLDTTTPARRCAVLGAAAFAAMYAGDFATTEELASAAIKDGIPEDCPAPNLAPVALGVVYATRGEADRAVDMMESLIADLSEREPVGFNLANLHATTATSAMAKGDIALARRHADEAVRLARVLGNPSSMVIGLFHLGWSVEADEPDRALAAFEEVLALTRAGASDVMLSSTLALAAKFVARKGDSTRALDMIHEGLFHAYEDGDRPTFLGNATWAVMPLVEVGYEDLAVQIYGATTLGAVVDAAPFLTPHQTAERDAMIEQLRDRLGAETFDQLAVQTAHLDYEQLAAFILGELDRIISERADA